MGDKENPLIIELDELTTLVTSVNWAQYLKLLKGRKEFLQKEVNRFVRGKDLMEAFGALSKLEDIDKTIDILKKRIEELRKGE